MENEIKVNEFVRTKYGEIAKVIEYKDEIVFDKEIKFYGMYRGYICEDELDFIVKHSPNLIDIIEDEDFCKIEFYSPRYEKRGTRIFEVSKIDEYITFENIHCDLFMINGEWSNNDKRLNPVIKEIYTKEMMESISYKVERKD